MEKNTQKIDALQAYFQKASKRKNIFGAVFCLANNEGDQLYFHSGELSPHSKYYIASINKLFISALVLRAIAQKLLSMEQMANVFLPAEIRDRIHQIKNRNFSSQISIGHLLSHTSGLACYLSDKDENGNCWMHDLEKGIDHFATPLISLKRASEMQAKFKPGSGRAYYSDTNFQWLCLILESINQKPIKVLLNELCDELSLTQTRVIDEHNLSEFTPPYFNRHPRLLYRFFTSTGNDIISTADDQIKFLKAFFKGYFFPKDQLKNLMQWKPIFFPFKYGCGIQLFYTPAWINWIFKVPDMIGHIGSTGSIAFYVPQYQLYIAGTINQKASPGLAIQIAYGLLKRVALHGFK